MTDSVACRGAAAIAAILLLAACAPQRAVRRPVAMPDSLESYIGKVRAVTAAARPAHDRGLSQNLEAWDPALAFALRAAAIDPSAARERQVALEYRRLGVLDMAYTHLSTAVRLDPQDAMAHDGLARIWRDWGFAHLGMPDALKAAELAPDSPVVANTVGTLLAATGDFARARDWYARALLLDSGAGYALNNICYADLMLRHRDAIVACRRAAAAAPGLVAARNNLGLAYAAEGDIDGARTAFAAAGAPGSADYNVGVVFMARKEFRKAADAFAAARRANPHLRWAAEREREARAKIAAVPEGLK